LTDVADPSVNEKILDAKLNQVGEDLEGVTHKVYFDIQINGSPAGLKFPPFFLFYLRV
jgi:peptidylprolyl isomerase